MSTTPLSQRSSATPKGCLTFFFLIFFLAGAAGSYFALWRPLSRLFASRSWTETQCDVLSSQVTEVSGSDGATYKVDVRYSWTAGGSTRVGSRYDFMAGSSSGREGKQGIVDRYPPGARVTCWVDPDDPNEAVLYRGLSPIYLIGLLPLVAGLLLLFLASSWPWVLGIVLIALSVPILGIGVSLLLGSGVAGWASRRWPFA